MRALVAALVVAVGGCGGRTAPAPARVVGPPIEKEVAEEDARGTLVEVYGAIQRGKHDNLFSVVDETLWSFGPRRTDVFSSRTDALLALGGVVEPGQTAKLRSSSLSVVPASRGRSVWAVDIVHVERQPLAVTAILSSEDEFFRVSAASLAWMVPAREIRAAQDAIAIVPPGATSPGRIAPGAEGAVERFRKGVRDPSLWGDDVARHDGAVYVGPTAGELARGRKEVARLWEKRLSSETRAVISGEIDAGITADGQIAWVTSPITRVEGDGAPLPLRAFAVFEQVGGEWTLAALHESLAIDEPGAGGPFVKIVPPPPAPPEPAVDETEDPELTAGKKGKKGKRGKKNEKAEQAEKAERTASKASASPSSKKATKSKSKSKSKKKRTKRRLSDDD